MMIPPALRLLLAGATLLTGLASSRNVLQRKRKAGVTAVQVDNDGAITKLEDHGCFLRGMADGAEYTASLNCPDLGLAGTIPAAISELTLLTSLFLNANALTGTIPPALGKLTRLETLARTQIPIRNRGKNFQRNHRDSLPRGLAWRSWRSNT